MKKKIFLGVVALVLSTVTIINVNVALNERHKSTLDLTSLEAQASDLGEWWDRPDWKCISVTCKDLFASWKSDVSEYAGAGKGTVAHSWSCTGCSGAGWLVD